MRSNIFAALFVSCAAGVFPAVAGPIEPAWVAPEATWVVHADLEAMHACSLGKELFKHINLEIGDEEDLEAHLALSLINEVKGVTIYGTTDDEDDGIVIVNASKNLDEAINALPALAPDYKKITEKDRTIHSFKEADGEWFIYQRPDQDPERRVLLIAHKMDRLMQGIATMEGGPKAPAAALRDANPRPGSCIFVSATKIPGLEGNEQASRILHNAQSVRLDAGESAGNVFASFRMETESKQEATDTAQVVQGLIALGRIAAGSDPALQSLNELFSAVKVGATEHAMSIDFSFDAARLQQLIEEKMALFGDDDKEEVHEHIHEHVRKHHHQDADKDADDADDEAPKPAAPIHEQPKKDKKPAL